MDAGYTFECGALAFGGRIATYRRRPVPEVAEVVFR
jgi:hypothetical protein